MATYLLAWNPNRWEWSDLTEESEKVKSRHAVPKPWSCGNNKQIGIGDRIFLICLGEGPKGIIASGKVVDGPREGLHWDAEKAKAGKRAMFVLVQFDTLLNPETDAILPRKMLNEPRFSQMHWDTQMSGVIIADDIARELERAWADFLAHPRDALPEQVKNAGAFLEGATRQISVNSYERNPEARRKCVEHYGATCVVCGFNSAATYGQVSEGIIHVHHLKELAEIKKEYEVDPIHDLRPVCPNCHAVMHSRKPAYSIEEVKELMRPAGS